MEIKNLERLPIRDKDAEALVNFVKQIKMALGAELLSVIIYGSAVKDNYFAGSSNLNLLVLVKDFTPEILYSTAPIAKRFRSHDRIETLLADIDDIRDATDVFPIRYLDLKEYHLVLWGEDIIRDIEIHHSNLRFDLERQVRSVVLSLRQMYMHSNHTAGEIRDILVSNFSGFSYFLSTLLILKNISPPQKKEDIIREVSRVFEIDLEVLKEIIALKRGGNNPPKAYMQDIFHRYIDVVDKIVEIVDKIQVDMDSRW